MGKNRRKKLIGTLFISLLAAVVFTGCMSKKEKEKAETYEKEAFWDAQKYLLDRYGSLGIVSNRESLTEPDGYWGAFAEHAMPYVQADVWLWGDTFNVVVNVDTGECYDNRKAEEVREQIEEYLYDKIDIPSPEHLEVYFNPTEIRLLSDENTNGYLPSGEVPDIEELFADSDYQISILLEYADSEIDFHKIDVEDLCEAGAEGPSVSLTFVNYRSSNGCENDVLTAGECINSTFMDARLLYYGKEVYNVNFDRDYKSQTDTFQYAGTVSDTCRHYRSKTVNGIRFVWVEEGYDVELTETTVPQTFYSENDNSTLYAVSDAAVAVTCHRKQWYGITDAVLCIEEKKPSRYKTVFWKEADREESAQIWTMRDIGENDCYHWITLQNDDVSVKLGAYQTK